jgi:hypothetical protein
MIFGYLISVLFDAHGPVTGLWTYSIDSHISIEYVVTNENRCNIALSFSMNNQEDTLAWEEFSVLDSNDDAVQIIHSPDGSSFSGTMLPGVMSRQNPDRPSWPSRTTFIMDSAAPRFSFSINVRSESESGEIAVSHADVMCDASICACSGMGEPRSPFQTRYTY